VVQTPGTIAPQIPKHPPLPIRLKKPPVLAPPNHLSLFRSPLPRLHVPPLLHDPILAQPRGIVFPQPHRRVRLAALLLLHVPPPPLATHVHALPRLPAILQPRLPLGSPQPQCSPELPGTVRLLGTVPPLGVAGFFLGAEQHPAEGGFVGNRCRTW
jgi:hypothetical protein